MIDNARRTMTSLQSYTRPLRPSTSEVAPSQALQWLRSMVKSYCSVIPGASDYIDSAFDEIEDTRKKHGCEVDRIIKEAYLELRQITIRDGTALDTVSQAWNIVQKLIQKVANVAGNAGRDILDNHPLLKDQFGSSLDHLRWLGATCGPEAKKQVDQVTWQISEIAKSSLPKDSAPKIRSLLQTNTQKLEEAQEKTWKQPWGKVKSLFDR